MGRDAELFNGPGHRAGQGKVTEFVKSSREDRMKS